MRRSVRSWLGSGLGGLLVGINSPKSLRFPVRIEHYLHGAPIVQKLHGLVEVGEALELVRDEVRDVQAGAEEVEHLDPRVEDPAPDDRVERQALEDQIVG